MIWCWTNVDRASLFLRKIKYITYYPRCIELYNSGISRNRRNRCLWKLCRRNPFWYTATRRCLMDINYWDWKECNYTKLSNHSHISFYCKIIPDIIVQWIILFNIKEILLTSGACDLNHFLSCDSTQLTGFSFSIQL